jgi:hypothetical protein
VCGNWGDNIYPCPKCGVLNKDDRQSCYNCGNLFNKYTQSTLYTPQKQSTQSPQQPGQIPQYSNQQITRGQVGKKSYFPLKLILTIIVIIVIFIAIVVIFSPERYSSNTVKFDYIETEITLDGLDLRGFISNTGKINEKDDKTIKTTDVSFNVYGSVLTDTIRYDLEDVIMDSNITEIKPKGSVEFYLDLPPLKTEVYSNRNRDLKITVKLFFKGYQNDVQDINVDHFYE